MSSPYILVTGFDATEGGLNNPAAILAFHLQRIQGVKAAVIPTVYDTCNSELQRLLAKEFRQHTLKAVVMLGQASRKPAIYLETSARNACSSTRQDGMLQTGPQPIIASGPNVYSSTLPIGALKAALEVAAIPVRESNDAGDYLCNYAAYIAADLLKDESIPCGFVHIPSLEKGTSSYGDYEPEGWVFKGMVTLLEALKKQL